MPTGSPEDAAAPVLSQLGNKSCYEMNTAQWLLQAAGRSAVGCHMQKCDEGWDEGWDDGANHHPEGLMKALC